MATGTDAVTCSRICSRTEVSANVYPVGTTRGTATCTPMVPAGTVNDADVPKGAIAGVVPSASTMLATKYADTVPLK
jgi:hypothetical protein